MIDLHTHILPNLDDGAIDLEMSLAMGRLGVEQGLKAVAATPHFYEISDWTLIKEQVAQLQKEFIRAEIEMELVPGAELLADLDLLEMDAGEIPTYGDQGKFSLIEFPLQQVPIYAEQVIFSLQTKGITPIIAHPERYGAVIENPNLVLDWLRKGCLIQINAGSILGRFGSKILETSKIMLTHNMVQFVASDAHGLERRRLNLPEAFKTLAEVVGPSLAKDLVETNPGSILKGNFQIREEPREYRKRRRFLFF